MMTNLAPTAVTDRLNYVDGQRVLSGNTDAGDDFEVLEPATGKPLTQFRCGNDCDINNAVANALLAFRSWSQLSGMQRGRVIHEASRILRSRREEIAPIESVNTGKPIWEARADIDSCADCMEYYGGLAASLSGEHITLPNGCWGYTRREPLGVVGGIGAWNYPCQMAAWKSAPALAAGNTMVFKPSPFTPLTAVMLAEIYTTAGVPPGVFNVVQGGAITGQLLSSHPSIAKMSFTGSVASGSKVMEACAAGIKHVTLELGGKSPIIIFEDADIDNAVSGTMMANFLSQGQVCSNGTRVFVHKDIWDVFTEKLVSRVKQMKIGDPLDEKTTVGATISEQHAKRVLAYIDGAKLEGARVLCGGERVVPADPLLSGGFYLSPCVLTDVNDDMVVAREEVFGSVACLLKFSTEEEVISRANNTIYGLAAGVFTKDLCRAHRVVAALQAGSIYVNNYNVYPSELPFGGYKQSGLGRELGRITFDYYTQLKSVYVEMGDVSCPI